MTNHYHFITVLLSFILAGSCNNQQHSATTTPLSFAVKVKGCAAEATTKAVVMITDSLTEAGANPFKMTGDTLLYRRTMKHLCCRKVKVDAALHDNTIVIEEKWHGYGCKCQCNSTIEAMVLHLKADSYNALVLSGGTDPLTNKPNTVKDTVWSGSIKVQ